MINYLKGKIISVSKTTNNRLMLVLEVNQVGYEIQIPSRFARKLSPDEEEILQVFTHQQIREEQQVLYGFSSAAERDLFRHLISVSGIGSQLAIALIDTLGLETLIESIITNNISTLCKAPGVGKKTAERISLELKAKLSQWRQVLGIEISEAVSSAIPSIKVLEEVEMTLLALGYTDEEIEQAMSALNQDSQLLKNHQVEDWIKAAITWLSN